MTRRLVALLVGAVVATVSFLLFVPFDRERAEAPGRIDLIARFPDADKRTTMGSLADGFAIVDVSLDGERRRAIFAHPLSRITWEVDVPPGAVLRTDIGMRMEAWWGEGDGATFRVGIGDGVGYQEYFERMLDPYNRSEDRGWFPVEIDLSAYGGRRVTVVFNTGAGPWDNTVRDAAVWGEPRIEWQAATPAP